MTAGSFQWLWDNGILKEDALATQRRYHLSHLAEEKTEAWRNENCIVNGAVVYPGAGAWVSGRRQPGWAGGLSQCPADHAVWAAASSIDEKTWLCGEMHLEHCTGSKFSRSGVW